VHLALNPKVQAKLHEELVQAVGETEGKITAKTLERKSTPYLHACIKETYRLTMPFGVVTTKKASQSEVEVHGITLPKGSVVSLNNKWNDEFVLEDAREFKPERWFPEAVNSRVGTELEQMDHALFRDTFGQGARRCPGNRVATNEVLAMISQLLLDYEIKFHEEVKNLDDIKYKMVAVLAPIIPQMVFKKRAGR